MDGEKKTVRLRITYQDGYAQATIEDKDGERPYEGYFKNFENKDPHEFCAGIADDIEKKLGVNVQWSMKEISATNVEQTKDVAPTPQQPSPQQQHEDKMQLLRKKYILLLASVKEEDIYSTALEKEKHLISQANGAEERVKAFADDEKEHDALVWAYRELQALWEECEEQLMAIASTTSDSEKRTALAVEINTSRDKAGKYKKKSAEAVLAKVHYFSPKNNTAKSSANTLQDVGNALSTAGGAMKDSGHKMTVGCTVPILIAIVLIILLMLLF